MLPDVDVAMMDLPIIALAMPGVGELVVIFLIVLVLFGASRIPEIARSIGKGIVEFKRALNSDTHKKDK